MASEDRTKWDARHAQSAGSGEAPRWIDALDAELPREGRALDVAAGDGRLARWAARRGLAVTAVDISPVGLAMAQRAAAREARSIDAVVMDLEEEALPAGPFALITCFHYRQPSLWPAMKARLAPGGFLLAEVLTVTNLERSARPSRRWLSAPGELCALADGLEILLSHEDWFDGRHAARLVARQPR